MGHQQKQANDSFTVCRAMAEVYIFWFNRKLSIKTAKHLIKIYAYKLTCDSDKSLVYIVYIILVYILKRNKLIVLLSMQKVKPSESGENTEWGKYVQNIKIMFNINLD